MRLIEIITDAGHLDTLRGIAAQHEITDLWWGAEGEDGRRACRMLVDDDRRQAVMDSLQQLLGTSENTHLVVLPVDAVLPRPEEDEESRRTRALSATREELYNQIERGARWGSNFFLLTALSTVVAAIGLLEDNLAVVIGAMVIAPLLGPHIAIAFGTSVGDRTLVWEATRTSLSGLALAIGLAVLIGLAWPVDMGSREIVGRTDVGLDNVALALASGAAAVLSLTTGLSSALVGVMVAVALLPPAATFGMLVGGGRYSLAGGAALLLAVNVVCVILAAKLVFLAKGVKPRTWYARRKALQSTRLYLLFWAILLLILIGVILLRSRLLA